MSEAKAWDAYLKEVDKVKARDHTIKVCQDCNGRQAEWLILLRDVAQAAQKTPNSTKLRTAIEYAEKGGAL